jgi:hypothetical protein
MVDGEREKIEISFSQEDVQNMSQRPAMAGEKEEGIVIEREEKPKMNESSSGNEEEVNDTNFVAGNIHNPRFRDFWKNELRASKWVLETLNDGYSIPFEVEPEQYDEPNNASAKSNMKKVRQLVSEMIANGVAKIVKEKPHCVSPLGLVSKTVEGVTKDRLVFDASRWVNLKIEEKHVKLAHLEKALELTEPEDHQATFDLKSAFYHIKIKESHQKFLGAAIENSDGKRVFFIYTHLPFGLKCAVHAITKMMKPVLAKFHSLGIRSTIYIDDGRILAKTKEDAQRFLGSTYEILKSSGWVVERKKSDNTEDVSQTKKYLGFIIDTKSMKVSVTSEKLNDISKLIKDNLTKEEVEVKILAKILGKIVSLKPSHGPLARICTRSGYLDIDEHVRVRGWKGKLRLSTPCKQELIFWQLNSEGRNGFPINNELRAVRVETIFKNPVLKKDVVRPFDTQHTNVVISDSSDVRAAIILLHEGEKREMAFMFNSQEKSFSSGHRELLAVKKSLAHWVDREREVMTRRKIYWATDSTNVVSFLEKGSSRKHIQSEIFEIVNKLMELQSEIIPVHLSREDERIREADLKSKTADSDDWSIDAGNFNKLKTRFQLEVDVFASDLNARLPRFYSELFSEKNSGTNAFAQMWGRGLWLCPPIKHLLTVANELKKRKNCEGILAIPDWPTSHFYNVFFDENKNAKWPFKIVERIRPYIYQNQGAGGALNGKVNYDFYILYFNRF